MHEVSSCRLRRTGKFSIYCYLAFRPIFYPFLFTSIYCCFCQTLKQGIFETMTTFKQIKLPEGPSLVDMCIIGSSTFDMLYLNDLNANFRPATMSATSTSAATLIASDNNELLKFVNPSRCVNVVEGCYSYCRDTCFRTIRVQLEGLSSWKLKLCSQGSSPTVCVLYKAGRRADSGEYTIMAHAPVGQTYSAAIVDKDGKAVVPKLQTIFYEENHCGSSRFQVSLAGYDGSIPFVPWSDW